MINVQIYRGTDQSRGYGPQFFYSFAPIETDVPRRIVGSGSAPWKVVMVPYQSMFRHHPGTNEMRLVLPEGGEPLRAYEVAVRFAG